MDNFPLNPLSSPYFLLKFGERERERERERDFWWARVESTWAHPNPFHFLLLIIQPKIPFWLCLAICKLFSKYKIFSGENIFGKGKYFLVFSCILKIVLENREVDRERDRNQVKGGGG